MLGRKKCIICDDRIDNKNYTNYEMKWQKGKSIGKFNVHPDCFEEGTVLLRKEVDNSHSHGYTNVTTHIDGEKYSFKLVRGNEGFTFLLGIPNQRGGYNPIKKMRKFFEKYVYKSGVIFVFMSELSGTSEGSIPRLVSLHDSLLNQEYIHGEIYQKHLADAKKEFKMSMKIRGKKGMEVMRILDAYVLKTSITI